MDLAQVEEQIIDTAEQVATFNQWLSNKATVKTLSFFYQLAEYLPLEDCGRHMNGQKGQMVKILLIFAHSILIY